MPPENPFKPAGATYVRWGRTACPQTADLVYSGKYIRFWVHKILKLNHSVKISGVIWKDQYICIHIFFHNQLIPLGKKAANHANRGVATNKTYIFLLFCFVTVLFVTYCRETQVCIILSLWTSHYVCDQLYTRISIGLKVERDGALPFVCICSYISWSSSLNNKAVCYIFNRSQK